MSRAKRSLDDGRVEEMIGVLSADQNCGTSTVSAFDNH